VLSQSSSTPLQTSGAGAQTSGTQRWVAASHKEPPGQPCCSQARLRLVAAIIDGLSARRYLEGVGLAEPRPGIAARGPPTERRVA
jgi:hypothetical protein